MSSQPTESSAEDLKNALQVLNAEEPYESRGQRWVEYAAEDVEAIRARLEAALSKLEAPVIGTSLEWPTAPLDYVIEAPDYDGE